MIGVDRAHVLRMDLQVALRPVAPLAGLAVEQFAAVDVGRRALLAGVAKIAGAGIDRRYLPRQRLVRGYRQVHGFSW